MKLAAILVAYNPNVVEVIRNIKAYANNVELSILWDNTPNAPNDWSKLKQLLPNTIIIADGKNIGLSAAYNKGIALALQQGCSHIMTMDQDSLFQNFDIFRKESEINIENHGLTAPPINTQNTKEGENIIVPHAAQSGCIFSLDMIQKIGPFRENFFIGMVDVEMQLRAEENGYTILQIGGCNLIHQVGSGRTVKLLGKEIHVSDYSPLRHYYDSRNRILMWKEFPYDCDIKYKFHHFRGRLSVITKIILFENYKLKKITAIIRGTFNGIFNRVIPY